MPELPENKPMIHDEFLKRLKKIVPVDGVRTVPSTEEQLTQHQEHASELRSKAAKILAPLSGDGFNTSFYGFADGAAYNQTFLDAMRPCLPDHSYDLLNAIRFEDAAGQF